MSIDLIIEQCDINYVDSLICTTSYRPSSVPPSMTSTPQRGRPKTPKTKTPVYSTNGDRSKGEGPCHPTKSPPGKVLSVAQNGEQSSSSESDSESEEDSSSSDNCITMNKPKGLIDGLSRFFTPSNKRKSRVSLSALEANGESGIKPLGKSKISQNHSKSQQAANKLIRKSKILQANKVRRRKLGGPPGSGQLKSLFDGLSHLFTAPGETRKRTVPMYSQPRRMRKIKIDPPPLSPSSHTDHSPVFTSTPWKDTGLAAETGAQDSRIPRPVGRGRGKAVVNRKVLSTPGMTPMKKGRGGSAAAATPPAKSGPVGRGRGRGRPRGKP